VLRTDFLLQNSHHCAAAIAVGKQLHVRLQTFVLGAVANALPQIIATPKFRRGQRGTFQSNSPAPRLKYKKEEERQENKMSARYANRMPSAGAGGYLV
jgi:hypothetical protein